MSYVRDGAFFRDVNVEAVGSPVLGHHRARRDDPVPLGQLTLRKVLSSRPGQHFSLLHSRGVNNLG